VGRFSIGCLAGALVLSLAVCKNRDEPPSSVTTTGQGEGGCPGGAPEALFSVTVRTADGEPLPADTTVTVRWSVGEEPSFVLDDPNTWKTLDDGVNAVCEVGGGGGDSTLELRCELWTSGATEVEVTATGYLDLEKTLTPASKEGCDQPVPSEEELELLPDPDAKP
jgi:hypothetical protein